jgi:hypothetical protein
LSSGSSENLAETNQEIEAEGAGDSEERHQEPGNRAPDTPDEQWVEEGAIEAGYCEKGKKCLHGVGLCRFMVCYRLSHGRKKATAGFRSVAVAGGSH